VIAPVMPWHPRVSLFTGEALWEEYANIADAKPRGSCLKYLLVLAWVLANTTLALAQQSPPSPTASQIEPRPDPFCAIHVVGVPWSQASGTASGSAADVMLLSLSSMSGSKLDAHVKLISETDAYDVALTDLALDGQPSAYSTGAIFVTLPKAATLRYAYVDSYRLDDGPEKSCATEPFDLRSWEAALQAPLSQPTSPRFAAALIGPLPPLPCGKTYTDAKVARAFQPPGINVNKTYTVQVGVLIDSEGHPVDTWIDKSSGIARADALAKASALLSQYTPATFLCAPIVHAYLFRVDFAP
jgi:hypothetical protein